MDLQRLKIDRGEQARSRPTGRGRQRSRWFSRLVLLAAAAGLLWLFRAPLLSFVDRLRLPAVRTALVEKPSAMEASAVTGTAANGYVVAKVRAALSADTPGRIVELNVQEGQAVKKGFVVARLFAEEYEAAFRRALADLAVTQAAEGRAEAEVGAARDDVTRLLSARSASVAELDEAKAGERLARIQLERIQTLVADGIESQGRLDEAAAEQAASAARVATADARLNAADATLEQARSRLKVAEASQLEAHAQVGVETARRDHAAATLDKTIIRAPFDGIVVLKDAEVGEVVSPNSQAGGSARGSVATMVDFSSLEVQAEVPETSVSAVRIGAPAQIFLDAWPERPYSGEVERIWPTADRQKATIEVRIRFLERDDRLRPEMGVRVVFVNEGQEAKAATEPGPDRDLLLIPYEAVVMEQGRSGVFVLERDRARYRVVTLGARKSDRVAVSGDLRPDERVIVAPPSTLADGDRVRVEQSP